MSVLYVTQACSERELISTFRSTNESIAYTEKRSKTIVLTLICTHAKSNWSLLRTYEGENTNPYLAQWLLQLQTRHCVLNTCSIQGEVGEFRSLLFLDRN